ncbi:DUF1540 domain-containing protein [Sulfobacillus harzensis]|uniref:DUF1540 domain-containing protein n=1 Tax=Sulfobacillus harzensis TaxID=2729629 RepID=A0A7Y0L684_9FIRM|nr:DUF1540 domain-containing protein [Sulfobacillus harzensis]NMP23205.1 DUF1540 domain-containing protein [Sulfobacillus harzensis]
MPQVQVRCTVDNCYFWVQDNLCGADTILITTDKAAEKYPESVDAAQTNMIVNEIGETPAQNCRETACKTFFHK